MPETKIRSKYATTTTHHDTYYQAVLLMFIAGLTANLSHAEIADRLNRANLQTPTGLLWDTATTKQTLKKIRLNRDYRSSFHSALLRLIYAGGLTVAQVQPLFAMRLTGVM